MAVEEVAEDGADNEWCLNDGRKVDAHTDGERRQHEALCRALEQLVDEDEDNAQAYADVDILPRKFAGEDALCNGGHECCLRGGERLRRVHARARHRTGEAVCLIEEVQHGSNDEGTDHTADEERHLLTPRCCTDEPTGL